MEKVCPVCKETKTCTQIKLGMLKAHFKCDQGHEFETNTIFKEAAPIVLSGIAVLLGIEANHKK